MYLVGCGPRSVKKWYSAAAEFRVLDRVCTRILSLPEQVGMRTTYSILTVFLCRDLYGTLLPLWVG